MPLYEFICDDCGTYFELGCEKHLDVSELLCVDCGTPEPRLLKVDEELSTRINNLVGAVQELAVRIENVEQHLLEEEAPAPKEKKTVN